MNSCWDLIAIAFNLYINLGRINIFSILTLVIHEHSMFLILIFFDFFIRVLCILLLLGGAFYK